MKTPMRVDPRANSCESMLRSFVFMSPALRLRTSHLEVQRSCTLSARDRSSQRTPVKKSPTPAQLRPRFVTVSATVVSCSSQSFMFDEYSATFPDFVCSSPVSARWTPAVSKLDSIYGHAVKPRLKVRKACSGKFLHAKLVVAPHSLRYSGSRLRSI